MIRNYAGRSRRRGWGSWLSRSWFCESRWESWPKSHHWPQPTSILQLKESGLRLRIEKIEKNTREEVARATIRCFPLSQNIEHWTFKTLFPAGSRSMLRNWEWTIYFCRIRLIPLTLLQSREKRSVMTKTKVTKKLNRRLCRCTATGPVF